MTDVMPAHFLPAEQAASRTGKVQPAIEPSPMADLWRVRAGGADLSAPIAHAEEELLLFCWEGTPRVQLCGREYALEHYDVLYVPRGQSYRIECREGTARLIACRATAENVAPALPRPLAGGLARRAADSASQGKDVFLMFDVSEPADKLMAGYTIFQPFQRSYRRTTIPTRKRFTSSPRAAGRWRSMPTKRTSRSSTRSAGRRRDDPDAQLPSRVQPGGAAALHLVHRRHRYWVGDKNKDFMTGKVRTT